MKDNYEKEKEGIVKMMSIPEQYELEAYLYRLAEAVRREIKPYGLNVYVYWDGYYERDVVFRVGDYDELSVLVIRPLDDFSKTLLTAGKEWKADVEAMTEAALDVARQKKRLPLDEVTAALRNSKNSCEFCTYRQEVVCPRVIEQTACIEGIREWLIKNLRLG